MLVLNLLILQIIGHLPEKLRIVRRTLEKDGTLVDFPFVSVRGPLRRRLEKKGVSAAGISFIMDRLLVLDSENRFAIGMSHPYLPEIGVSESEIDFLGVKSGPKRAASKSSEKIDDAIDGDSKSAQVGSTAPPLIKTPTPAVERSISEPKELIKSSKNSEKVGILAPRDPPGRNPQQKNPNSPACADLSKILEIKPSGKGTVKPSKSSDLQESSKNETTKAQPKKSTDVQCRSSGLTPIPAKEMAKVNPVATKESQKITTPSTKESQKVLSPTVAGSTKVAYSPVTQSAKGITAKESPKVSIPSDKQSQS
jgi:hypothetical protein